MAKKHLDPNVFQPGLLSLLPDTEPLNAYIVRPKDKSWSEALAELAECGYFGFDIETWGAMPDWGLDPWKGNIRLMQAGLPSGKVIVVDLGGREGCSGDNPEVIASFLSVVKKKLECKQTKVIGHNLKFDCLWMLVKFGIETRCTRCTMILSQIYWAGVRKYRHGLKPVAARLGFGEVDKTEQTSDWSWILSNSQLNYASLDALLVIDIFKKLGEMLNQEGMRNVAIAECMALPAWVMIEHQGMPVCKETLDATLLAYQSVEREVIQPWYDAFPHVNPASQPQVLEAVKEKYQIELKNAKGKEAVDQDALIPHCEIPALQALLDWRTLLTYINYLEALVDNYMDGAVRSSYRQLIPMGTRSGSSKPNLQNPPRHESLPKSVKHHNLPPLRGVFKASEGYNFLIADLSQAHARLATVVARDQTMIEIYRQAKDTHCVTAEGLARVNRKGSEWTAENIGKWKKNKGHANHAEAALLRQVAKPVYYGSLNRQGAVTLKATTLRESGIDMTEDEAKAAIQAWRKTYKGIYKFQCNLTDTANRNEVEYAGQKFGVVRGLSNRRIHIPKWEKKWRGQIEVSVKPSDASSACWAGDEKTVMALAMGEGGFLGVLDKHPEWGAWISNSVHDELDVTVKSEYALEAATELQRCMQSAMDVLIQGVIPVDEPDAKPEDMIAKNWAEK